MSNTIRLMTTGNRINAAANSNPVNKGNVRAEAGSSIDWVGMPPNGNGEYVVTFRDLEATNAGDIDWPFMPHEDTYGDKKLRVPLRGPSQPTTTNLLANDHRKWSYEVTRGNLEPLDPMIIVRDANLPPVAKLNVKAVGAITFLAGTVVGMLLTRW